MKNTFRFKTVLLQANLIIPILFGITSCNNNPKLKDQKIITDEQNQITLDSTNQEKNAQFLATVAEINLEEIRLGELAQQNSTTEDVRQLGEMIENDHRKSLNDLSMLAQKKSITLPTTLTADAENDYKKLSIQTGKDFDKSYCDMMVNGHKDAISMFEKESTESSDADIRQWVTATIPVLQKHLDHSLVCQEKCKK